MNEPNSVIGDILQLCLLVNAGKKHSNVSPQEFRHISVAGPTRTFDGTSTYDFFNYEVPENRCLVVTYFSLYTSDSNGTETWVNYGININAFARIMQVINGTPSVVTGNVASQGLINKPVFFVFPGGSTPRLRIAGTGAVSPGYDLVLEATMQAYLAPASCKDILSQYQTIPIYTATY